MAHTSDEDGNDFQFQWGKKRGVGGAKKDVRFYESFTYDGVNYTLYDCVYLYKNGEPEPYIGKIIKIWEQSDGKKKVKILWFFHPSEIQNYLGNYTPLENEVFLGSGEGVGLTNINPLEAIAGKCYVICASKDERNPQPSNKELEMADYIFNCTFDVQKYTLSDKLSDKIAGIEVKFLLNRRAFEKSYSGSNLDSNGGAAHGKTDVSADLLCNDANSDSLGTLETKVVKDEGPARAANSTLKDDVAKDKHLDESKCISNEKTVAKSLSNPIKDGCRPVKVEANHDEEKPTSARDTGPPSLSDDRPSKKPRKVEDSIKILNNPQKNKGDTVIRKKLKIESDEEDLVEDYTQLHKESFERTELSKKKAKLDASTLGSPAISIKRDTKADNQIVEVMRSSDTDRSRWFKEVPWEGKILKADEQGTLVFVDNLDPSFTSADVQDIFRHFCDQTCTAKVIPLSTFQNTNYGRAYVVFGTREKADLAIQKLNKECLMLAYGRPLICSKGLLKVPPKSSMLSGHLSIDKIKLQMQREEMKKAVSTSHCSQPNTIEYEMAMDWMLIQEKYVNCYRQLYKGHGELGKQIKNSLKSK